MWDRTRDAVEVPRPSVFERLLRGAGLPAHEARLVAVASAFRGVWLTGVAAVLAFAALAAAAGHARGVWLFLAVAPVMPCLVVASSYDPWMDPALEPELVTPYPALRLILLRTIAVLALALPAVLLFGLVVPGETPFAWLLPAVGFVAVVLAASTWVSPLRAAIAVSTVWLAVVWLLAARSHARTGAAGGRGGVAGAGLGIMCRMPWRQRHWRRRRVWTPGRPGAAIVDLRAGAAVGGDRPARRRDPDRRLRASSDRDSRDAGDRAAVVFGPAGMVRVPTASGLTDRRPAGRTGRKFAQCGQAGRGRDFWGREPRHRPGDLTAADLAAAVAAAGGDVSDEHDLDRIVAAVSQDLRPGDVLITMGAGDIGKIDQAFFTGFEPIVRRS